MRKRVGRLDSQVSRGQGRSTTLLRSRKLMLSAANQWPLEQSLQVIRAQLAIAKNLMQEPRSAALDTDYRESNGR
jgi:hypothetical protein